MATLKRGVIAIELPHHGEFATSIETVRKIERQHTRDDLARLLAESYSDTFGDASRFTYWRAMPKTILVVVYGGMVEPQN